MENDGNDRERILTSLVCTFPDKVFTEMDLVPENQFINYSSITPTVVY